MLSEMWPLAVPINEGPFGPEEVCESVMSEPSADPKLPDYIRRTVLATARMLNANYLEREKELNECYRLLFDCIAEQFTTRELTSVLDRIPTWALWAASEVGLKIPSSLVPLQIISITRRSPWRLEGESSYHELPRESGVNDSSNKVSSFKALSEQIGRFEITKGAAAKFFRGRLEYWRSKIELAALANQASTIQSPPNLSSPRPRGPKPDYATASRVAEIVAQFAPDGEWRSKLDEICDALDQSNIRCPKTWRRRDGKYTCWSDCLERHLIIKAIDARLKLAKAHRRKIGDEPSPNFR
jgi:hypothetical protein